MPSALELREQRKLAWERMKEINSEAERENRDFTPAEEGEWTDLDKSIGTLDERIQRADKLERTPRMDSQDVTEKRMEISKRIVEMSMNQHSAQRNPNIRASAEYSSAFFRYMQTGEVGLEREEQELLVAGRSNLTPTDIRALEAQLGPAAVRALGSQSMTAGGYLVPEELENKIEQAMSWFGGMREVAEIMTTADGGDLKLPTSNDTTNSGRRLAENTTLTQTDPVVALRTWRAYTYTSDLVLVPWQLLQDSIIDVESWLTNILAERIGRAQNTDFTVGTGIDQPWGLAQASVVGRTGAAGQTTTVIWDDLIFLEHAVNIAYRGGPGVRYMMHDQTVRDIRRLTDGEGRYLWQAGVAAGAPNTINGYQYTINNDVATMATSARSIIFGNLKKYIIRQVRGIAMVRLNERYADALQTGFFAYARADGGLLDAGTNPSQVYQNAAS